MRKLTTLILVLLLLSELLPVLPGPATAQVRDRQAELPSIGGVYRRPLEFNPRNLDPAEAVDIYSVAVIQQLFDGLVQFDRELNILPALARSWKVSPDGLTYSFVLREGAKFHNGREMTADDAVYSFTRIVDARTKSPASHFLDRVLGARDFRDGKAESVRGLAAREKHLFEVKLTEPYAPFLSMLGMNKFKILPREEVERPGVPFARAPVGTGPFRFGSMKEGEEIVLEANTSYFEGRPFLDRIVFRVFHGAPREKIFREFKEGHLEESLVPAEELEAVVKEKRYLFFQKPILSLRFYGFNGAVKPLDNRRVRRALLLAVDRKAILSQVHRNQFNLARSILPPGMPGYDPTLDPFPYDEGQAKRLLAEAGYPGGRGLPALEIWSASNSEAAQREIREIRAQWERIGVQSSLHFETSWPAYEAALAARKAPVFIYAWYADLPDPDNFLGILFHSASKYNYSGFHHPEVDELLSRAVRERDDLKRAGLYRKAEKRILEEAPLLPMVNNLYQLACQPSVRGMEVNALGGPYLPMKRIWLKKAP